VDKITEKVLMHDTIAESEKILGRDHHSQFDDKDMQFVIWKAALDNQTKKDYLQSIGDTHFGMTWDEFKNMLVNYGFINGLTYKFDYKKRKEEAIIYYQPIKGMIVFATSWDNKSVNSGNLYAEIKANSKEDRETIWRWLSTGGCIDSENMIYETQHDVREGLFSKLNELETAGTFLNRWTNQKRFLWFVDYAESKKKGYDNTIITQQKINKLPKEARAIMGK
jgi:hypothetical protein